MRICVTGFLVGCLLLLATPTIAQECGDVNGDGDLTITDVAMIMDYISHYEDYTGPAFHATEADCDGRAGITVSDAVTVTDNIYKFEDHRDCTPTGTYSLTLSLSDTVFIPYVVNVPTEISTLELPIMTSLVESTDGVYISLLTDQTTTGGLFELNAIGYLENNPFEYANLAQLLEGNDSCSIFFIEKVSGGLTGERIPFFVMEFTRTGDGAANIAPTELVRSPLWRITVEKDGDLFIPVIVYYEFELPDPILSVNPTTLSFTAASTRASDDTFEINFTSTERIVTFDLDISAPWMAIEGDPVGPYTTPVTFIVTADAASLVEGNYAATITPVNLAPEGTILDDAIVAVDFAVGPEPTLPWGDLNCTGDVTIGDIALMIDCVFLDPRPIPDCREPSPSK